MKFYRGQHEILHRWIQHSLSTIACTIKYSSSAFPLRNLPNSYANFVFLRFLRSLERTGSTILQRMIIKRGRVAWTFGKRPRFVQQSALTADRNTWTRATSTSGQRVWEGEVRVEGWGVGGRRGLEGPGDFNRGLRAPCSQLACRIGRSDFAKRLTKPLRPLTCRRLILYIKDNNK